MNKLNIILSSTCAFTVISSFGMEKDTNQHPQDLSVSFDTVALLTENNQLLRQIKKQNRAILKQNYLHFKYETSLVESSTSKTISERELQQKHKFASKIKETYIAQRLADTSWESSDEDIL